MKKALLSCDKLMKSYSDKQVVKGLSFEIYPGECLGLIGPNGAGKTTALKMCLGLLEPDAGRIIAFDQEMPKDALSIKSHIGVVSQFDTLDPDFTCAENLLVYGRYFGLKKGYLKDKIPQLLEFAALSNKANERPGALSGGMKRRLSLARALVNDPALLLLDEPTTGLDPQARHVMWERLQDLVRAGKSILLTTHFMDEAERLCDRLIVMDHGEKIAQGSPKALIAEHLERMVVEVYGLYDKELVLKELSPLAQRVEESGETLFFYTHDATALNMALSKTPEIRSFHRPSNLEDLFLKLTGRQIREGA
ncbi:MAG: ATP-binding cassette domain-containing protein [Betaproteobacteria bacterium]|jgi:lipooligosaccharide transport system ATP-binding protein